MLNIRNVTLDVGASAPFRALHVSDSHICLCDGRDNERKNALAVSRAGAFGGNEKLKANLEEAAAVARERGETLLYTGDLLDFVSEANLDYAAKAFEGTDTFVCAGNHEYSQYVGEAWEDEEYKAQSFARVKAAFPGNDVWYSEREMNGVVFAAVDNNYYYVLPEQLERFGALLSTGKPVVLMMHNPLYSADAYRQVMNGKKPYAPPYLCGCPDDLLLPLEDYRRRQQTADETTREFCTLCGSSPNLRAVLAGHLHTFYQTALDSGVPQIVCGAGYAGEAVEYLFR